MSQTIWTISFSDGVLERNLHNYGRWCQSNPILEIKIYIHLFRWIPCGLVFTVGARFMMYGLPMEVGDLWLVAELPRITMDRFAADGL